MSSMLRCAAQGPDEAIIKSMDTLMQLALMQLATCHAWSGQEAIARAAECILEHSISAAGGPLSIGNAVTTMAPACCPS